MLTRATQQELVKRFALTPPFGDPLHRGRMEPAGECASPPSVCPCMREVGRGAHTVATVCVQARGGGEG